VGTTGAFGHDYPVVALVLGVVLAGSVHAVKAASRPVVNVTTAGIGGPIASLTEDFMAALSTAAAILAPILVLGVIGATGWLFWKFWWQRRRKAAEMKAEAARAETAVTAEAADGVDPPGPKADAPSRDPA